MSKKKGEHHKKHKNRKKYPNMGEVAPRKLPDRRAMEKSLADLHRALESREFESEEEMDACMQEMLESGVPSPARELTPLEKAQDLMYEAWDSKGSRRVKLAREALRICPDCADAYVLLAEETASRPEEARELYAKGVEAGERALGPEFFEAEQGHFWGILESRPYMRAREGLANVLWYLGDKEAASEHFMEMLRLNPNDNQGIRYMAANTLFTLQKYRELEKLLDEYDEKSTFWLYNRALFEYVKKGDLQKTRKALRKALAANPYVPAYFFAQKEIPRQEPLFYTPGGEKEAVIYVSECSEAWATTEGAFVWLMMTIVEDYTRIMTED